MGAPPGADIATRPPRPNFPWMDLNSRQCARFWPVVTTMAVFSLAIVVTIDSADALDPRSVVATELRLRDWLHLRPDDRQIFVDGFALGWHRTPPAAQPEPEISEEQAEQPDEPVEDPAVAVDTAVTMFDGLDLAITRLANAPRTSETRLATALARAQILGRMHHPNLSTAQWLALPHRHKFMLLQGIQAGTYARESWESLNRSQASAAIDDRLAVARQMFRPPLSGDPIMMMSWLEDSVHIVDDAEVSFVETVKSISDRMATSGALQAPAAPSQ